MLKNNFSDLPVGDRDVSQSPSMQMRSSIEVHLMERHRIKRLPVLRKGKMVASSAVPICSGKHSSVVTKNLAQ